MVVEAKNIIQKQFGAKVRKYRKLAHLTQEQLADKCGCSSQTISGTETGYSFPSSNVLFKLSEVLDIPLVYLFNFDDNSELSNIENANLSSKLYNQLDKRHQEVILNVMIELCKNK